MDSVTLWIVDADRGQYVVADSGGTVLLGPFFSHPDPCVTGQRLANTLRRRVDQRESSTHPSAEPSMKFWPVCEGVY
jgi:hypothetical protein